MTEKGTKREHKLSHELLGILVITLLLSALLFWFVSLCGRAIAGLWLDGRDIVLTDGQLALLDGWVFNLSLLAAAGFFLALSLFLMGERLACIRPIIRGVDALRAGQLDHRLIPEGSNELTRLAEAVNYLADTQREIKERERALSQEREQLIRTLSHDIRTPLTSILSYSEFLAGDAGGTPEQRAEYLALIRRKAGQIKELTDLLLEGGRRVVEPFGDGRLLLEPLVAAFEEGLEDEFHLSTDLGALPPFKGAFDVGELRRVFDNLSSNIRKYADPHRPVALAVSMGEDGALRICQQNHRRADADAADSHGLGLISIRRIAHNYGGRVELREEEALYSVTVILSEF